MLLDIFGGLLLPQLQAEGLLPSTTVLFDAESLFLEGVIEDNFPRYFARAGELFREGPMSLEVLAQRLVAEIRRTLGTPSHPPKLEITSTGLVRMLTEFREGACDFLGATTHFCAFRRMKDFRSVPVYMPSLTDAVSPLHWLYNHTCGVVPGCFCLPGGGTMARTGLLVCFMEALLRLYPQIYGEDALLTVLAEQAGFKPILSRQVRITNRCPTVGERSAIDQPESWKVQFVKWYCAFGQIRRLYGEEICRSVLGPSEQDVLLAGAAIAACEFEITRAPQSITKTLRDIAACGGAFAEVEQMLGTTAQEST